MNVRIRKMIRYVFGAGKIGKQIVEFLQRIQLNVTYIFDNNEKKWGTEISGVPVMKFDKQYLIKEDSLIYIACANCHDIMIQLKEESVPDKQIVVADSIFADTFLSSIAYHIISAAKAEMLKGTSQCEVLFDLSGGMVLGGVEQWNYELAEKLKEKEINAAYFVVVNDSDKPESTICPSINVNKDADIVYYVKKIMEANSRVIVCNFPFSIMKAACIVKRCYDKHLKIIAIVHNDIELYYKTYNFWGKEIDRCFGISEKIEKEIKASKQLTDKFMRLNWKINVLLVKDRVYSKNSEMLRIGYAGRIVEHQKRLDRTVPIAKELVRRNVNFTIQIAGDGIYRTKLEEIICENNLQNYFQFLGRLDHGQMQEFWKNQDIYLNCSDYEGHSIAQAEAMASGAVPVMMDVSGAQDDIENGENGFVVPVGDVKGMAEKIEWLYRNRNLLPIMGAKSIKKIETNNKLADSDLKVLIDEIIGKNI